MEAVSKAMSLSAPVTKMTVLLATSGKLNLVPELAAAYRRAPAVAPERGARRRDERGAVVAGKQQALEESLSKVTGKKVEITASVDPELLGGVVARIGSTVYDGSVKTQLTNMRQELVKQ